MNDPRLQALLDQLDTIWLFLERPVVQGQLLAFALISLLSWLLPAPLGTRLSTMVDRQMALDRQRKEQGLPVSPRRRRLLRWARGLQLILFPVVGLIATLIAAVYLSGQGWPVGLLRRLRMLFWLVLVYRVAGGILYAAMETEMARRYQARFVRPIFVILMVIALGAGLAASFPIFSTTLITVLGAAISLQNLATAAMVFYLFLAAAWITRDLLRNVVQPRIAADPGVFNTITVVTNYTIIGVGLLTAMSIVGFNLSALAIVGGGLSVGIGFGLQELVANFISGILLLFEQTLRPGDVIEVAGQRGKVDHLYMRATVLRTSNNVEVLVPNKTLLTSTVATHPNSERTIRHSLHVGVSYAADPQRVRDILLALAANHGRVLTNPPPAVLFSGFGESCLEFDLAIWLSSSSPADQVLSDLRFMIFKEFKKNNIEIPYPQRDLHVYTKDPDGDSPTAAQDQPATEIATLVPAEKPRLPQ